MGWMGWGGCGGGGQKADIHGGRRPTKNVGVWVAGAPHSLIPCFWPPEASLPETTTAAAFLYLFFDIAQTFVSEQIYWTSKFQTKTRSSLLKTKCQPISGKMPTDVRNENPTPFWKVLKYTLVIQRRFRKILEHR